MARQCGRSPSLQDYTTLKGKRRLEIFGSIVSAVLLAALIVGHLVSKNKEAVHIPCEENSTQHQENITDAFLRRHLTDDNVIFSDGMVYPPWAYWISNQGDVWGCPCSVKPCIYKCCDHGQFLNITCEIFEGEKDCLGECTDSNMSLKLEESIIYSKELKEIAIKKDHYHVMIFDESRSSCDLGLLDEEEEKNSFVTVDGRLYNNKDFRSKQFMGHLEFCVDSSTSSSSASFMICLKSDVGESSSPLEREWVYWVKCVALVTSVPCLVATSLVYVLLPQLRNLHGRSLVCHVSSLAVANTSLALAQLSPSRLCPAICISLGFLAQFSILASFFWLNAMSFDIWWVFSGLMPLRGTQKDAETRKFLAYSAYAWGCALLVLAVTLAMDYAPGVPLTAIRPGMGAAHCFFNDDDARLLYLYLPMGVLVYLNCLMFLTTAVRLRSHSQAVRSLQCGDSRRHCRAGKGLADLQRFSLYLKLFLVMGVNWVLELLSFFFSRGSSAANLLWLLPDLGNALQGVLILALFVCKAPLLRQVSVRLSRSRGSRSSRSRPHPHGSASLPKTSSSLAKTPVSVSVTLSAEG